MGEKKRPQHLAAAVTLICSRCLLPDFQPRMLHARWGTGGFAARLTFPAVDAQSVVTRQLRPPMLADSQKHPILLQPPCQHPYYLLPPVLYRLGCFALARSWMRWVLRRHVVLRRTALVGGGGRLRLAGDPRVSDSFSVTLETSLRKGEGISRPFARDPRGPLWS